jgi:hypothetical protein
VHPDEPERERGGDRLARRAAGVEHASEGLPVGVQIVGRPWREDHVLCLMQTAERALRERDDYPVTPIDP